MMELEPEDYHVFMKYMNHYEIWTDDKLNLNNMDGLLDDIMDGLE